MNAHWGSHVQKTKMREINITQYLGSYVQVFFELFNVDMGNRSHSKSNQIERIWIITHPKKKKKTKKRVQKLRNEGGHPDPELSIQFKTKPYLPTLRQNFGARSCYSGPSQKFLYAYLVIEIGTAGYFL